MREHHETLLAADGYALAATLFEPRGNPHAAVILSGATAVPRRYYADYARFLASRGFSVLTYDYRGMGDSAARPAAAPPPRMRHWGERDLPAAIGAAEKRFPGVPLLAVGHSVGGQLLGLAANNAKVVGQLAISSQSGFYGLWPWPARTIVWALWYLIVPILLALLGRIPGFVLGGLPLPSGVATDWMRWCRNPHYIIDDQGCPLLEHYHRYHGRMRFYAIRDDAFFAPLAAVRALIERYPHATAELRFLEAPLGHFGFFRSPGIPFWDETAAWLLQVAAPRILSQVA